MQEDLVGKADVREPKPGRRSRAGGWKRARRFTLKTLLVVGGLFLLLVAGLMLMSAFSLEGIDSFRRRLDRVAEILVYGRLLAIGLLIGFWCPFNSWLAKIRGWTKEQLQRVLGGRWWALVMLLFIELVLVQRIHEPLIEMVK